ALDEALAVAAVVLAADAPSQALVASGLSHLSTAVDGLVALDGATAAPARGQLSHDNGWDTGIADGDYTVHMNLWWGTNGSKLRIFENGELVSTQQLAFGGVAPQKATLPVAGKGNGIYTYTGELVNSQGTTALAAVTVTVTHANPGTPQLSHDNWDRDGRYAVTANLWWGTNASSYRFFENGAAVGGGTLTAATPAAQTARLDVSGKAPGTYSYRVEFSNAAGTTTSSTIQVVVAR
ncbi:MAG: chitinase N-terminal domain-containing protein, partial [Aeromicrobium sp.]